MNQKKKKKISEYLRIIARKEGITENEVREEIAFAISLALKSKDPQIQNFWRNIPCNGESPTIEEIIDYVVTELSTKK